MGFHDVEATQLADALVAFLDLLADVPRAASNFPFVNAGVAAERPSRRFHQPAAPAADRLPGGVTFGLAPLVGGHDTGAPGGHERDIGRRVWIFSGVLEQEVRRSEENIL
jgi:hypothetical protein